MPVAYIKEVAPDVKLGLWKIEEAALKFLSDSLDMRELFDSEISAYKSNSRRLEKLAVYSLLWKMTNSKIRISHNEAGKPIVDGYNISISHTRGYASVILSKLKNVAVDIEYYTDRVARIADKFIRKDEIAPDIDSQLINWSVKETVYKYFSEQSLQYFDMKLMPFEEFENTKRVFNLKMNSYLDVYYELNDKYVLTYTYHKD
ncbi:siderophore biosynthesis protein [Prevotella herbatica]|uniref:Siderophore biosynthesis protein n=1 Tax=Prevotella herbatica TaxID=2801997 RepID=A0ABM7NUY7_9BACT|nr:4'-phosphopantetheinyl transferase family protein [Prevotella herbatica]BCS84320.1 siderophore biosynthesis protein [Prevotella herbatica]